MKSILVVGEDPRSFEAVLAMVWLIAERFESYVEGVAVRALTVPITPVVGFGDVAVTTLESLQAEEFIRAAQLKNAFQEFAHGHQTSGDPGAGERGSVIANWPIDDPVLVQTLGERGRVFDLIVIGRSSDALKTPDTPSWNLPFSTAVDPF
jgi:hypothetical protein